MQENQKTSDTTLIESLGADCASKMCMCPLTLSNDYRPRSNHYSEAARVVPCGKCILCLRRRQNAWAFRLTEEQKQSTSSCFITLTYAKQPISFNGHPTLEKKDFQLFLKRLRASLKNIKIKYYACGEYGTETLRPHYHFIMFNLPQTYINDSEYIHSAWAHGHVDIRPATYETIRYVTKYIIKGRHEPLTDCDDRTPEFSLMSKKMGLNHLTPQMLKHYKEKLISHVTLSGGIKTALPRYFRDKIFNKEEKHILNQQAEINRDESFITKFNESYLNELSWKKQIVKQQEKANLTERATV